MNSGDILSPRSGAGPDKIVGRCHACGNRVSEREAFWCHVQNGTMLYHWSCKFPWMKMKDKREG